MVNTALDKVCVWSILKCAQEGYVIKDNLKGKKPDNGLHIDCKRALGLIKKSGGELTFLDQIEGFYLAGHLKVDKCEDCIKAMDRLREKNKKSESKNKKEKKKISATSNELAFSLRYFWYIQRLKFWHLCFL